MSEKVVGIGAGGHAKVILDIFGADDRFEIVGMLDKNPALHGKNLLGVPVLGNDEMLPDLFKKGIRCFFIGLGSTGSTRPRRRIFEEAVGLGMEPVSAIHASSVISPSAKVGRGAQIMANAVVNPSADIGINNIINTGAIIEHDCILGDHVHIATGARLASSVKVGNMAFIGAGATVRQLIEIAEGAIVGAGAVVVKNVPAGHTVVGNPAKRLEI